MVYILLTIVTGVFLLLVFKWFSRYKVNTFYAIMVNYFTAALTGILFAGTSFDLPVILQAPWLKVAFPLGLLFIIIFYLISQTTQKISIATASVANKMSVAMPVLFSILVLHQQLTLFKGLGIILAMVSVYLTTRITSGSGKSNRSYVWLPVTVFVGSGLIDIVINAANAYYIHSPADSSNFTTCTFISAFAFGLILVLAGYIQPRWSLSLPLTGRTDALKALIGGIILGIPNYFSIYFIFKSLESGLMSSAELFPLLNVSNVVLAALLGFLVYRERLSFLNVLGIALAVAAIFFIAL